MCLLLIVVLLPTSPSNAQLFNRTSGYTKTDTGYIYKGKEYIYGVHRGIPGCSCPMCRDLNAAFARGLSPTQIVEETHSLPTSMPAEAIKMAFTILSPKPNEVVLDPGCGLGVPLFHAVSEYQARGVGIEINPTTYQQAKDHLAPFSDKIALYQGDCRTYSFQHADYVVLYLFPSLIKDLAPKFLSLKPGTKVLSYMHPLSFPSRKITVDEHTFYLWESK